jgi:hypothetical protein
MGESWEFMVLSALVFLGAINILKQMPGARDSRMAAGGLGILALAVAAVRPDLRWHLLWFTPVAIVAAYLYGLRRLFGLSRRLKKIGNTGMTDPEQIRRALQREIDEYNRTAPDDQKMR